MADCEYCAKLNSGIGCWLLKGLLSFGNHASTLLLHVLVEVVCTLLCALEIVSGAEHNLPFGPARTGIKRLWPLQAKEPNIFHR